MLYGGNQGLEPLKKLKKIEIKELMRRTNGEKVKDMLEKSSTCDYC